MWRSYWLSMSTVLSDFCALKKNVCAETRQNGVTETTPWTVCLTFDSHFVLSKCPPPASFYACLQSWCETFNSLVDRFLWQAAADHLQRFFEFGDWFGFGMELVIGLQHRALDMVVHGSGEFGGQWLFLMNSVQLTRSHSCAMCVWRW